MRCPRCAFENMPGLTSCVRCNSVLVAGASVDVYPPRAGWRKRFRRVGYLFTRLCWSFRTSIGGKRLREDEERNEFVNALADLLAGALSIIPGLGHLWRQKWGRLLWLWPGYVLFLFAGVFVIGSNTGNLLLGIAIALHVWIIIEAGDLLNSVPRFRFRLLLVLLIIALVVRFGYSPVYNAAQEYVFGIYASGDIPELEIQQRDYLLALRIRNENQGPERGDLVAFHASGGAIAAGHVVGGGQALGVILGLPEEKVLIRDSELEVQQDGVAIARRSMPMLSDDSEFVLSSSPEQYFCLRLDEDYFRSFSRIPQGAQDSFFDLTAVIDRDAIRGEVIMLYNPLLRRRFIEDISLEQLGVETP